MERVKILIEQIKEITVALIDQFTDEEDKNKVSDILYSCVSRIDNYTSKNKRNLHVRATFLYIDLLHDKEKMYEFFNQFNLDIDDPNIDIGDVLFTYINSTNNKKIKEYLMQLEELVCE